jgi:hypothetical protein
MSEKRDPQYGGGTVWVTDGGGRARAVERLRAVWNEAGVRLDPEARWCLVIREGPTPRLTRWHSSTTPWEGPAGAGAEFWFLDWPDEELDTVTMALTAAALTRAAVPPPGPSAHQRAEVGRGPDRSPLVAQRGQPALIFAGSPPPAPSGRRLSAALMARTVQVPAPPRRASGG